MGTKNEPGAFDCYAKLEPDEPYFLLRGKDPSAPFLTRAWAESRRGNFQALYDIFVEMTKDPGVQSRISSDEHEKLIEARQCAASMEEWRRKKGAKGSTVMSGSLTVKRPGGGKE